MQSWTVCNPTAPVVPGVAREVRGVEGLAGRTLGLLDNVKPNADHLLLRVAERLRERYGVERVIHLRKPSATHPAPAETLDRLAREAHVVLTSTAD